jgi:hypothetical protein
MRSRAHDAVRFLFPRSALGVHRLATTSKRAVTLIRQRLTVSLPEWSENQRVARLQRPKGASVQPDWVIAFNPGLTDLAALFESALHELLQLMRASTIDG